MVVEISNRERALSDTEVRGLLATGLEELDLIPDGQVKGLLLAHVGFIFAYGVFLGRIRLRR